MTLNKIIPGIGFEVYDWVDIDDIANIAEEINKNIPIPKLDLSHQQLRTQDLLPILEALVNSTSVVSLYLFDNEVDDEGAQEIAKILRSNNTIQTLNLGCNNISIDGLKLLFSACKRNNTLTSLSVQNNEGWDFITTDDLNDLFKTNKIITIKGNFVDYNYAGISV